MHEDDSKPADPDHERHRLKMANRKERVRERMERAQRDAGVLLVLTGPGKGKSSSGFGMVARALGHDMKVGVVQFIKGALPSGEERFFRRFPGEVEYHIAGEGYTWETQDRMRDIRRAEEGWTRACRMLADESLGLVLLDELNVALSYGYLDVAQVIAGLARRPPLQHVVITGRGAPRALIEAADTVSELRVVSHAYNKGIRAQKGIEW